MDAPRLLLELLDEGIQLQVVDGRLRADFPAGTRTPERSEVIRSVRERLIDLVSRSAAEILITLRLAGIIVSLEGDRIRVEGDLSALTAEQRALIRFHRDDLVAELQRELSAGAIVTGRVWSITDEILTFGPDELEAYCCELVNCPVADPATPEEWVALAHAQRVCAGDVA
jgi:hypothetical protein